MKTLILVRHAKSSWDDPAMADFDRPLNGRGKRDAPRMALHLQQMKLIPQLVLSSPAKRAVKTARIFAQTLLGDKTAVQTDERIYEASSDDLLTVVRDLDDACSCCMLFGHNPGLTDFANVLIRQPGRHLDNIPTTGVLALRLDINSWSQLAPFAGEVARFETPSDLPPE